jgi:hypothetical protein
LGFDHPASEFHGYGQLYLTEQQMLVGVRHDNQCYLVYDLPNEKFIGHGDIEAISPFICLNATDTLNPEDIAAIHKTLVQETPGTPGYPHRDAIASGLEHPNPRVKELATQLLSNGKWPALLGDQ